MICKDCDQIFKNIVEGAQRRQATGMMQDDTGF